MDSTETFWLFTDVIVPSSRQFNHPTSLSFVAAALRLTSLGMDIALGAAEIFGGNGDGGSGAIHTENQVIAWLANLMGGLPTHIAVSRHTRIF